MMKAGLFLFFAVLIVCRVTGQSGYEQTAARFRAFYNMRQSDSIYAMFSARVKTALPPDKTKQMVEQLQSQFGILQSAVLAKMNGSFASFKDSFSNAILVMNLALDTAGRIDGLRFIPFSADQTAATHGRDPSNYILKTPQGSIYGTLTVPEASGKVPVLLIIAGSGPTDRDGNGADLTLLHSNMYQMLADSMRIHGIATLRYDKRGIGESTAAGSSEAKMQFEDLVSDAVGFVKMLQQDSRFSKVIILGHSEGSLVGMITAFRQKADAYISVAGAGERIDKVIERQLGARSPELVVRATSLFDSLVRGIPVGAPPSNLDFLFRSSIQPYMISWLRYSPPQEISRLKIPVLIVQGSTDLQVNEGDAERLHKAKPDATLDIIAQMNHVLKQATEDTPQNLATYTNPTLPLKPELIRDLVRFIR